MSAQMTYFWLFLRQTASVTALTVLSCSSLAPPTSQPSCITSSPSLTLLLWWESLHVCWYLFLYYLLFLCDLEYSTVPSFILICNILCPQLCYLHADFYKQTNSKETRKELHTFFIDRGAVSLHPALCRTTYTQRGIGLDFSKLLWRVITFQGHYNN